ncbi:MAG: hypothetical protein HY040_19245 [Planctomycetes bacterium]|nr:hypothetical protein [Planctomycetota bacterium]
MERNERVESGEKLFVIGMVVSFVTEVAYTTASVLEGVWGGFFLGLIGALIVLRLANWLYTGNNVALKWMLGWTALQLTLALAAWALLSATSGRDSVAHALGYGISWVPLGKLAAYAILGAILMSPSVRAFLFLRGGGELTDIKEKLPPTLTGKTLPLSPAETQTVAGLANLLKWASWSLIAVGVLRLCLGGKLYSNEPDWIKAAPALVEGFVTLLVGVLLLGPSGAFDFLKTKSTDTTYLMSALEQLGSFYQKQGVLLALVAMVVFGALVIRLLG